MLIVCLYSSSLSVCLLCIFRWACFFCSYIMPRERSVITKERMNCHKFRTSSTYVVDCGLCGFGFLISAGLSGGFQLWTCGAVFSMILTWWCAWYQDQGVVLSQEESRAVYLCLQDVAVICVIDVKKILLETGLRQEICNCWSPLRGTRSEAPNVGASAFCEALMSASCTTFVPCLV